MDFIQYHNRAAGNHCQVHKIKREKVIAGDMIDEKIVRKHLKRVRRAILLSRFALASAGAVPGVSAPCGACVAYHPPATARMIPRLPGPIGGNRYARL